ncbi:MAG: M28 family peptidase [Planctomycetes bacterium]|nr:M28 family peptidase [Planctomycetota bacterium]
MQNWIQEIVAFGVRRPGSPENLATEQYLVQKFKEFGLTDTHCEPVPVNYWAPQSVELSVAKLGQKIDCFAVPYTAWTPAEGIEAEAVYIGDGSEAELDAVDLTGKLAVFDVRFSILSGAMLRSGSHFIHDPGQTIPDGPMHVANWLIENFAAYYEVQRRGGVGLVGILSDSPIDGSEHYVPYDGYLKDLPAVWVGRELGAEVTELARQRQSLRLTSVGTTSEVDSHNVVATVPGQGDESIVLTCHHDAPFASAVEDASGLSVLLWLARHFAERQDKLKRNLIFVASSGHFHGGIGNRVFVEKHRGNLLDKIVAAIGIEHIAEEAEPDGRGGYQLTGRPEPRILLTDKNPPMLELLRAGVEKWQLERVMAVDAYLFGPEPPCDSAPFFTAGIPSVCHISGPLYLFDPHDTIDKVRVEDLPRVAGLFQELVEQVDNVSGAELEVGLARHRDDPPAEMPSWFRPPPEA